MKFEIFHVRQDPPHNFVQQNRTNFPFVWNEANVNKAFATKQDTCCIHRLFEIVVVRTSKAMRFFQSLVTAAVVVRVTATSGNKDTNTCEWNKDCYNGGVCVSLKEDGARRCRCPETYSGVRCEKQCPLQCANGGRCYERKGEESINTGNPELYFHSNKDNLPSDIKILEQGINPSYVAYACHCKGLFTGDLCDIPYANCGDMTRCYHGGECQPNSKTEPCKCATGYSGRYCEIRENNDEKMDFMEVPSIAQLPQEPTKKSLWPFTFASVAVGTLFGISAFVWHKRKSQVHSAWFVSSHARSFSFEESSTWKDSSRTYINVI